MDTTRRELIEKAIKATGGRQEDLAAAMSAAGLRTIQQHISKLLNGERDLTAETAVAIHIATKGEVPGSALRPDLWVRPEHVPISEQVSA